MQSIRVNNISKRFGDTQAVKNVSFEVVPGEIFGLLGPNGSGKTTLIRNLAGNVTPQHGKIIFMARDITHLDTSERAKIFSVVPQARNLPPAFTAWETVLLGRTPHLNWLGQVSDMDTEIACQAMKRTNTLDIAQRRIAELSGGEQQRLLLARAITQQTPVILMDEPTTHLDLKYQYNLLEEIRGIALADRKAIILVLHDLNLVSRYADKIALLVDGRIKAFGSAEEVMQPGLLKSVYEVDLQVLNGGNAPVYILPPKKPRAD